MIMMQSRRFLHNIFLSNVLTLERKALYSTLGCGTFAFATFGILKKVSKSESQNESDNHTQYETAVCNKNFATESYFTKAKLKQLCNYCLQKNVIDFSKFVVHAKSNENSSKADSTQEHENIPDFPITRKISCNKGPQNIKLTLFQYQNCPFCCKVRAFLDYNGFSYDVIEVNSVTRKQLKWSTKYKKVPILICEDTNGTKTALHDSSVIISLLQSWRQVEKESVAQLWKYYPELEEKGKMGRKKYDYPNKYAIMYGESKCEKPNEKDSKYEQNWRAWVDDVLVHILSPNIYRTPSEAFQAFKYFSDAGCWEESFSTLQRYLIIGVGSGFMYLLGKSLKKKYNLDDDVRQSMYDACNQWTKELKTKPYVGGTKPNLADLAMYGAISSIEGCTTFKDVVRRNKQFFAWYMRMKSDVQSNSGASGV